MSGYEDSAGLNVHNHYGARKLGSVAGKIKTEGAENQLTLIVTGETLNSTFLPEVVLPAGSVVTKAVAQVTEAFDLGGTTPTIAVGTADSETTNGVELDETSAETAGYYDITADLAGTWDAEAALAADTTIGVDMGGTSPTADSESGRVVFVITYFNVT